MGQQQLLLIVLGIVVVGIAIALSLTLFRANAIESKRDILIDECKNLGAKAIEYYKKPMMLGGGGRKFTGWEIPGNMAVSANGSFSANVEDEKVIITGVGNELATGADSIEVETTVTANSITAKIIH